MASETESFQNRLHDQRLPHLQECLVELQLQKCCTIIMMTKISVEELNFNLVQALQQSRNANSLKVLVKRHTYVKQITRHRPVTCPTMTELKLVYKHDCGIKI